MEIETHHIDVLDKWQNIVEILARRGPEEIHVVFNMIDCSEYWDAAIHSLCMYNGGRLFITGGVFSQ